MKRSLFLFCGTALISTFLLTACRKDNTIATDPNAEAAEMQRIRTYLNDTYGFRPEDIVETEDAFVVEGDQAFAKADFWENYAVASPNELLVDGAAGEEGAAGDRKHYRSSYLVTSTQWKIKVNIDYTVPQVWRTAILDAIDEWNDQDGRFYFEPTYYNYSVLGSINIKMNENIGSDTYALTYYPTSKGRPGSPMYLNPVYNNADALSANGKVGVMVHEIGHAISFRHTDGGVGTLITNVSNTCKNGSDYYSFMQGEGDFYFGFTNCDRQAYWAIYP